jgi:hypothetical protein
MPVFDDGMGEPEIGGHSKQNLAFRRGRIGIVQYMQDRPEAIRWEQPFQYAGKPPPQFTVQHRGSVAPLVLHVNNCFIGLRPYTKTIF